MCSTPRSTPYPTSTTSAPASKRQKLGVTTPPHPYLFHLSTVSSLSPSLNQYTLTLPDVISGRPDFIVLSNYLIQPSFLLSTCPLLSTTRTLVLAHTLITPGWDSYDKTAPFDPLHPIIDVHYPKLNSRYGCMHR